MSASDRSSFKLSEYSILTEYTIREQSLSACASLGTSSVKSSTFSTANSLNDDQVFTKGPSINQVMRELKLQTVSNQILSSESGIDITKALMKWDGEIRNEHAKVQKWIQIAEAKKKELESRAAMLEIYEKFIASLPVNSFVLDVLEMKAPSNDVQTAKSPTMSELEVFDRMAGLCGEVSLCKLDTCLSNSYETSSASEDSRSSSSCSTSDSSDSGSSSGSPSGSSNSSSVSSASSNE
uniref:Uncharacterized protein n=1 Tax=Ditylenchus dipsaci TaxID=166011 RepID=A0A915DEV8_9BILA